MSPLTLPGTIRGMFRRCSPVVALVATAAGDVFFAAGARAIVSEVDYDAGLVLIEGGWFALDQWALDLSDPTGRAHAAWWLADQPDNELVVCRRRVPPRWTCGPGANDSHGDRLWHLTGYGCAPYRDAFEGDDPRVVVPALAALNPNDPRLLPDGSRWVDAEALRLVCLHVAGVSA
jgi:hypothetical protein